MTAFIVVVLVGPAVSIAAVLGVQEFGCGQRRRGAWCVRRSGFSGQRSAERAARWIRHDRKRQAASWVTAMASPSVKGLKATHHQENVIAGDT